MTQPGMTVVCGDSHTATHGAVGALAFGIGTSEVENVLASQCLLQRPSKTFRVNVTGSLKTGVSAKDIILALIAQIGIGGGTGTVLEYTGSAIRALDMEGRMTVCNMSIEGGARAGMIAPDDTTFQYLHGRQFAPKGADWDAAVARWRKLPTDEGAKFDREVTINGDALEPMITWGTNPGMGVSINGAIPEPSSVSDPLERDALAKALIYMGLEGGQAARRPCRQCGLHRQLHQFAHLRSAQRRGCSERPQSESERARDGGSRLHGSEAAGRCRRAARNFPRRRMRLARAGLLHVHRDERRSAAAGPVQRFDQQPQFRRPAGQRRPNVPRLAADRRRQRPHRRCYRREDHPVKPFLPFESRLVPMPNNNIDTDQIIPARFLKTTSKEGLDKQLFCDWRYDAQGNPKPDFILNTPRGQNARDPAGRRQLRLRQFARACAVGADAVRIPRRDQHLVRGYLQRQRAEEFAAADRGAARRFTPSFSRFPKTRRSKWIWPRKPSRCPMASASNSRWTRSRRPVCSKASTNSAGF